jgi:hypothetical protein
MVSVSGERLSFGGFPDLMAVVVTVVVLGCVRHSSSMEVGDRR